MDEAEEDQVEFVVAGGDATEALESTAESFDLVAAAIADTVVGPGRVAIAGRRDDWVVAQVARPLARLVAVVGAVHDQRRAACDRSEPSQEVAASRCIAGLTR